MALTPSQIRAGIIALLTDATSAGARVYDTRMRPWPVGQVFPAIDVARDTGTGREISKSRGRIRREDVVVIEGVVAQAGTTGGPIAADAADAALAAGMDTLEGEILSALYSDDDWWQSFDETSFTVDLDLDTESKTRLGHVAVTLTLVQTDVLYEAAPPDASNSLELVVLEIDTDDDGTPETTQNITLTGDP